MQLTLLKSKIHRATVTGASLDYEGSLTISADIAQTVGLLAYEKILVGNLQNGERFGTYVIYGAPGKGLIELNGATAHLGKIGHLLTIMSFARLTAKKQRHIGLRLQCSTGKTGSSAAHRQRRARAEENGRRKFCRRAIANRRFVVISCNIDMKLPELPPFDHKPKRYSGPSADEVLRLRHSERSEESHSRGVGHTNYLA